MSCTMSRKTFAAFVIAIGSLSALPAAAQDLGPATALAVQDSMSPAARMTGAGGALTTPALLGARNRLSGELAAGSGAAGRAPRWQASAAPANSETSGLAAAMSSVVAPQDSAPAGGGSITQLGFGSLGSSAALDAR